MFSLADQTGVMSLVALKGLFWGWKVPAEFWAAWYQMLSSSEKAIICGCEKGREESRGNPQLFWFRSMWKGEMARQETTGECTKNGGKHLCNISYMLGTAVWDLQVLHYLSFYYCCSHHDIHIGSKSYNILIGILLLSVLAGWKWRGVYSLLQVELCPLQNWIPNPHCLVWK